MKQLTILFVLIALTTATVSCGKTSYFQYQKYPEVRSLLDITPDYPAVRFVVFSDTHFHDASLGSSGAAYTKYLKDDSKLLHLSGNILDAGIARIAAERPDFVLVPGDLTKDGERINHERFRDRIKSLAKRFPKIYVVPGNHDINNGMACRYNGDAIEPVETVTSAEFSKIYADYGYDGASAKDESSLSYVVEPAAGLWVLALDSCIYRDNKPGKHPETDGEFSEATLKWIEATLIRSKKEKKAVIAFSHHGIMEHYPYNERYYGRFVINQYERVSELFAAYGVKLVFTGHYHAQDITVKKLDTPGRFVFDIETGSFVTHPTPYRVITIDHGQKVRIESRFITSIASKREGFERYAYDYIYNGTLGMVEKALRKYRVSAKDIEAVAPDITRAYVAHLRGDEKKPEKPISASSPGLMGRVAMKFQGKLIEGWNTDLPPADNELEIDLKTGEWR
ncbi:MAG TPA: metallophosphoesterase [Spirochaetota bacterium]|nr:metallophosphoesterase [Spirochaetota bacterium]